MDAINSQMDFSLSKASFRHDSNCLSLIEAPPGFRTRHISPLHVPIVISDVAISSSSASGSANTVVLRWNEAGEKYFFRTFSIFNSKTIQKSLTHRKSLRWCTLDTRRPSLEPFDLFCARYSCRFQDHTVS